MLLYADPGGVSAHPQALGAPGSRRGPCATGTGERAQAKRRALRRPYGVSQSPTDISVGALSREACPGPDAGPDPGGRSRARPENAPVSLTGERIPVPLERNSH